MEKEPESYTDTDLKAVKDYEEKTKILEADREKYRKMLEMEYKKLEKTIEVKYICAYCLSFKYVLILYSNVSKI